MTTTDFTATIMVPQAPQDVTNAITNIRGWWSEGIEGDTTKLNSDFIYHYKDVHYCKCRLIELVAGKRVVWLVLDNYFKFTKDKTEWIGTKLVFDITQKNTGTEVRFTHEGLVPQYECYEVCREAWTMYITESLFALITTGKGKPNAKEDNNFNAQLVENWRLEEKAEALNAGMKDYQKTIALHKPAHEVYAAITGHIAGWWGNDLAGMSARAGDSFDIAFGKTKKTFEIIEAVSDEKVVWKCTKAHINMASLTNKNEWEGTIIIWMLKPEGSNTTLHFLHKGLNKGLECYDVCESGWNTFLASLEAYIETGKGRPYLKL
ncbi:MAG TPA: SRPBCC domain-containing protein [Chitinophagaceae bacterium]|nr:SRPBCC domain-containing protein [Chitinophagaceae bacterium]